MDGYLGRKVVLKWKGATLHGVQQKDLSINGEPIDQTADDDQGWRTLLAEPGQKEVNISISGVEKYGVLKATSLSNARTETASLTYENGDVLSGTFYLASYNEGHAKDGASTFSAELQSSGEVTFVAA